MCVFVFFYHKTPSLLNIVEYSTVRAPNTQNNFNLIKTVGFEHGSKLVSKTCF